MKNCAQKLKGFTLIEMIVAVGIFTTILFIASSAFLSVVNSDRKSRVTRLAIDNLNIAIEDMSRRIKTGTSYNCGGGTGTADCSVAKDMFGFTDQNGVRLIYKRGSGPGLIAGGASVSGCGSILYQPGQGCILVSDALGIFSRTTSPELDIISLNFWVSGSSPYPVDKKQPSVVVAIDGALGSTSANQAEKSSLKIQTAITQRMYDR